jgi:competence protein ComFC
MLLKPWLDACLGFLYPEVCQICGRDHATVKEGFVCAPCARQVRYIEAPFCSRCGLPYEGDLSGPFQCANCSNIDLHFDFARSAALAHGLVRDIIHRYKYTRHVWFEVFLAGVLVRRAAPELAHGRWDMIVPVPLHPAKLREREFNQAERLARQLSIATRIPLQTKLLRRIDPTSSQTRLSREQRAANVRKAFALGQPLKLKGARVVLVDDVFTTGATTSACAKVLKAAGAGGVCVWTLARGI